MQEGQIDEKRLVVLNAWLGLPVETPEKTVSAPDLAEVLANLRDPVPPVSAQMRIIMDKTWQNLQLRMAEPSLLDRFADFIRFALAPKILAPALAILIAGVVFMVNTRQSNVYLLTSGGKIDISKGLYHSPANELSSGMVGQVNLSMRTVNGLYAVENSKDLAIGFAAGKVLVEYPKTPERKKFTITDPNATYEVTGTKFLIDSAKASDRLYVLEGEVKVWSQAVMVKVPAGNSWSSEAPATVTKDDKIVKTAIEQFVHHPENQVKQPKIPKPEKNDATSIYLSNGQILEGRLISENADAVIFELASPKRRITVDRESISRIVQKK
jgi:hypothetical protein